MKHIHLIMLFLILLTGCTTANQVMLENRQHLSNLAIGMTKSEVHAVMGQKTVRSFNSPYRTAMYVGKDGKPIENFYYWTDGHSAGGITDNELTPVVFLDGKVIGWGREFWTEFVTKYELKIKHE